MVCDGYDGSIRWRPGERLEHLFEQRCDSTPAAIAVDGPGGHLSFAELDARANQLARFLSLRAGVRAGDRVALLMDRPVDGYVAMLAVLKLRAAYVPLDPAFPADRVAYIASDASISTVLTHSRLRGALERTPPSVRVVNLDEAELALAGERDTRLTASEVSEAANDLCYIIYTSGTTGRPKGVAVHHPSIVNFVRVAAEVYGLEPQDRLYQGLTLAFDFSVEEIWLAWMVGATLVPKPGDGPLLGHELHEFLTAERVTALCCVPTLLATLDRALPGLRFLLVSGESCPQDLVDRWSAPGRRFLNVYGPTETTVSATWTVLDPSRAVTIGVPLPTYSAVVLEPGGHRVLPAGELGELAIAGIGVAGGYVNRPEATERAFIHDFVGMPGNPSGRLYRTGDLVRINHAGELEHHGRIDTQIKLRGYRIEVAEIEIELRRLTAISQVVVEAYEPRPGLKELVAYYTGASELDPAELAGSLRETLPGYMVPAYFERLHTIPMLPSGKVDRASLPAPGARRGSAAQANHVYPGSPIERALERELAGVLGLERVCVEANFFTSLGANSLLMAQFAARLRSADAGLPPASIREIYLHPTVRQLAGALARTQSTDGPDGAPACEEPEQPAAIGTPRYLLCGLLQLLAFLAYASVGALALDLGTSWLVAGHGVLSVYMRALGFGASLVVATGALPILAKWVLIGRWRPQRIRIWSVSYVRFWLVKTLVRANPALLLFRGTLLYPLYLRALGAKIGPGVLLTSEHMPICTDVIDIGAGSVIRRGTYMNGYRAKDGVIEIGPVEVGSDAFVGENCVLDVYSRLEDGATLGHASSLQAGQVVPAGATWHGSPAEPAEAGWDYRTVPALPVSRTRRIAFSGLLVALLLLVGAPGEVAAVSLLLTHPSFIVSLSTPDAVLSAAALLLAALLIGLLVVGLVPRLLSTLLKPHRAYPLFGLHHTVQRLVGGLSNISMFTRLFGDSVAIDGYLRYLGWRLRNVKHSGSNFGLITEQDIPALTSAGSGTMVCDGLTVMNAEFSSTSFRVVPVHIGDRCFVGNRIAWPGGSRTGDNLLLATRAMVPIGGEIRSDTGLLGSPCFEIPRTVEDREAFAHVQQGPERLRRLRAKTRHNVATMGLFLFSRFAFIGLSLIVAFAPLGGWLGTAGSELLDLTVLPIGVFGLAEIAAGSRRLRPRTCSILERDFWGIERLWKLASDFYLRLLDGTPFKGTLWRLLGVQVGPRLFDDGCGISERALTRIGADVTLNMGCELQAHSLEDGVFKSDGIDIRRGSTLGVAALVHYGVTVGEGAVVEADSFVMKGSQVRPGSRWRGNPANEVSSHPQVAEVLPHQAAATPERADTGEPALKAA